MIAAPVVSCYPNENVYEPARGRYAPRNGIQDRLRTASPVVEGRPGAGESRTKIVRELRIRFYQPKTIKSYRNALRAFLRWFGGAPHRVTREDVRAYLEYLVDAGARSSWVSGNLSAIRTAFDKMCGRRVTLGLATPRRPKRLPVVLSAEEVRRLFQAAPSLRDKLLLGLMYATGMRVSLNHLSSRQRSCSAYSSPAHPRDSHIWSLFDGGESQELAIPCVLATDTIPLAEHQHDGDDKTDSIIDPIVRRCGRDRFLPGNVGRQSRSFHLRNPPLVMDGGYALHEPGTLRAAHAQVTAAAASRTDGDKAAYEAV